MTIFWFNMLDQSFIEFEFYGRKTFKCILVKIKPKLKIFLTKMTRKIDKV